MRFNDFALAMHPDDIWRTAESAEHQNDATIFFDVRDRFHTAAGQVQINNGSLVENLERPAILWRTINVASLRQGRCRYEKYLLGRKPSGQFLVNRIVYFAHGKWWAKAIRRSMVGRSVPDRRRAPFNGLGGSSGAVEARHSPVGPSPGACRTLLGE